MTVYVIDFLEAVEIDAKQGEAVAGRLCQIDSGGKALVECDAVWQIGQQIIVRHVRDALLMPLLFGQIINDVDQILCFAVWALDR